MNCNNCGATYERHNTFCENCGAVIKKNNKRNKVGIWITISVLAISILIFFFYLEEEKSKKQFYDDLVELLRDTTYYFEVLYDLGGEFLSYNGYDNNLGYPVKLEVAAISISGDKRYEEVSDKIRQYDLNEYPHMLTFYSDLTRELDSLAFSLISELGINSQNLNFIDLINGYESFEKKYYSQMESICSYHARIKKILLENNTRPDEVIKIKDISMDMVTDSSGIDTAVKSVLAEQYSYVGEMSEGFILVKNNNLYGYVNELGELVIPLIYRDANAFKKGRAIVSQSENYGVINTLGKYVIDPKYQRIQMEDEFFLASSSDDYYLYDLDGNFIISESCKSIIVGTDNRITLSKYSKGQTKTLNYYIYDYTGKELYVFDEGVWVGKYSDGYALFKDGQSKKIKDTISSAIYAGLYTYIDVNGKKATNDYFVTASDFENNHAVVAIGTSYKDGSGKEIEKWHIINSEFKETHNLGKLGDIEYKGMWKEFVIFKVIRGMGHFSYIMVDKNNQNVNGYYMDLQVINEANALIVQIEDTGLYGLIIGDRLAKDYEYNWIFYEGNGAFTLLQGDIKTAFKTKVIK